MDTAPPEERINRLLNQLENPGLSAMEIELIERKISVLRSLTSQ